MVVAARLGLFLFLSTLFASAAANHSSLIRRSPIIVKLADNVTAVVDSTTGQTIQQGPASDGSGTAFSLPAVLWIVFCFLLGPPLAAVGIRGWRVTSGIGVGLALTVCTWAAFINTMGSNGLASTPQNSDTILSVIVLGSFLFGFVIGCFDIGLIAGITLLSLLGGLSLGIRLVLLRSDLLFSSVYALNWVVVVLFGVAGGLSILWRQRIAVITASALAGSFLLFLGIDLALNQQSGMSRGLRFLFDRNDAHILDLATGYNPPISSTVLIAISFPLAAAFAYFQHRYFPEPFSRKTPEPDLESIPEGAGIPPMFPVPVPVSHRDRQRPRVPRTSMQQSTVQQTVWNGVQPNQMSMQMSHISPPELSSRFPPIPIPIRSTSLSQPQRERQVERLQQPAPMMQVQTQMPLPATISMERPLDSNGFTMQTISPTLRRDPSNRLNRF